MYRTAAVREPEEEVLGEAVQRSERLHQRRVAIAACLLVGLVAIAAVVIEHAHLARSRPLRRTPVRTELLFATATPIATPSVISYAPLAPRRPARSHGGGSIVMKEVPPLEVRPSKLPPEVIRRIVRQNYGRFRLCYEKVLREDPHLHGVVAIKFVIDRSGAVAQAQDAGSSLPNNEVISCIARGFLNLSFPQPDNGIVAVTYNLSLAPPPDDEG